MFVEFGALRYGSESVAEFGAYIFPSSLSVSSGGGGGGGGGLSVANRAFPSSSIRSYPSTILREFPKS